MKKLNNKGNLNMLLAGAIMVVILAITFGLGGKILSDVGTGATTNSSLANATAYGNATINSMGSYLPTIGLVLIIATVLGLLLTYLYQRFVKGDGGL